MRISDWSSDVCSSDLLWSARTGIRRGRILHAGEDRLYRRLGSALRHSRQGGNDGDGEEQAYSATISTAETMGSPTRFAKSIVSIPSDTVAGRTIVAAFSFTLPRANGSTPRRAAPPLTATSTTRLPAAVSPGPKACRVTRDRKGKRLNSRH